jgi:hypothetical protein
LPYLKYFLNYIKTFNFTNSPFYTFQKAKTFII